MKCLPRSKLSSANGNVLHDCHAEILAIRTFNRYLVHECSRLADDASAESCIVERNSEAQIAPLSPYPYSIRQGITIHMYCSEAPCGDASMELIMDAQEDPTPWGRPAPETPEDMPGRADFAHLGIVRRKPGE
jgi:tRNA-specific adenosine deaminase 1